MAKSKPLPPARDRVTWSPCDPTGERQRWAHDAMAFARLKRRPTAGAVVAAIAQRLSAGYGYSWVTNEQLANDIGAKHTSAVERALTIADNELGIIIRETTPQKNDAGKVIGRHRRIFAARPLDMAEALASARRTTNPENPKNRDGETKASSKFRGRESSFVPTAKQAQPPPESRKKSRIGSDAYPSKPSLKFRPNPESSIPEPRVARGIVKTNSTLQRKDSYGLPQSEKSILRYPSSPEAIRLVNALAFIGPDEENSDELLKAGRLAWALHHRGRVSANDVSAVHDHLKDAACRAWLDQQAEVIKMLAAPWPSGDVLPWENRHYVVTAN